ncbi:hypothetical protein GWD52_21230 [Enterobacteriaceae bacterium 4M9]|nr:hypothetical protein [Enterobacteriaceae bacterium 4M9]
MENVGGIYYEIKAETGALLKADKEVVKFTEKVESSFNKADGAVIEFTETAKRTSAALKMPEVNKLSGQLAQLTGKIGATSDATQNAAASNSKFSGILSTVAGKLGAGYVSNVGSATSSLILNAKAALDATSAHVEVAKAAQQEAISLQSAAAALAAKATEEKTLAEAAAKTATTELAAAEAIFERKTADIASLEALLARQKESLRQAEANLTVTNSEKAVAAAVKARNAVDATSAKVQRLSNQAVKEVIAAEDKAKAAKEAVVVANQKLAASVELEAVALSTVAKANDAAAIATERYTLAAKAQAVAISGARSAINLLGGPSGILLLAAAGVYSLYQAMSQKQDIEQFKKEIEDAAKRVEYLTDVQAKAAAAKTKITIDADTEKLKEASLNVAELKNRLSSAMTFNAPQKDIDDLSNQLGVAQGEYDELSESVRRNTNLLDSFSQHAANTSGVTTEAARANEIYDNSLKSLVSSNELLEKAINGSLSAAEELAATSQLEQSLSEAGISAEQAAIQVAKLQDEFERKRSLTFEQMLKQTEQNVNALKIEMQEGAEAAAVYRAQLQAAELGVTDKGDLEKLIAATRKQVQLQKQLSSSKKQNSSAGKTKKQTDSATQALSRQKAALDRLNTGYADGSLELAKYDAVLALGNKATTEQIAKAEQQAEAIWKATQAVKNLAQAEQGRKYAQQEVAAYSVMQNAHTGNAIDPVAQVNLQEQQKLAALAKYQALDKENTQLYEDAKTAIQQQAANERINIARDEAQRQVGLINTMLDGVGQGFDGLATIIANSKGENNAAYKALFAVSKGFASAQAALNLQLALSNALASGPFPWNLSAMAQVASAGGSLISSIANVGYSGGRRYGGGVSAGNAYRINEDGRSEIFQTSSGQQMFIPNKSGKVVSADNAGGGVQNVYFTINTTGGISDSEWAQIEAKAVNISKKMALFHISDQANRPGGMIQPRRK